MNPPRPWYAERFDDTYLDLYAHRDAAEAELATVRLLDPLGLAGRRVLDVACGAGRFVGVVAQRGASVVGVDLSADLLRTAHASGDPPPLGLVRADMRQLPFATGSFDLVLSMFTSFGYFPTAAEDRAALAEMARVLRPNGDLVLDFLNAERLRRLPPETTERDAGPYRVHETRRLDPAGERVVKEIELRRGTEVRRYREEVRVWSAADLEAALAAAGCAVVQRWGDYEARPFVLAESPRLVLHARRSAA